MPEPATAPEPVCRPEPVGLPLFGGGAGGSDTPPGSLSPRGVLLQRAREVMSALQFQDRDTAVRLLQEALALLEA